MSRFNVFVLCCVAVAVYEVQAAVISDVPDASGVPGVSSFSNNLDEAREFATSGISSVSDGVTSASNVPGASSFSRSTSVRQAGLSSVPNVPSITSSSGTPSIPSISDGTILSGEISSSESYENQPELEIISLCSQVPTFYENLVNGYINMPTDGSSAEQLQFMRQNENQLKEKIEELRQYVNQYDDRVAANDPDARNIQNLMSSAVDELVQSVDKINADLNTEMVRNGGTKDAEDRVKTIQGYVKPAMARFEEFCLLETKDILKNVLQDFEAGLVA